LVYIGVDIGVLIEMGQWIIPHPTGIVFADLCCGHGIGMLVVTPSLGVISNNLLNQKQDLFVC